MIFSTPLAAFGFLSAAALVALYSLRRKHPPKRISSLMLWPPATRTPATSARQDRPHLPPIFFLELLILLLLSFAALTPLVFRESKGTLHILLDRSPSTQASAPALDDFLTQERQKGNKDFIRVREFTSEDQLLLTLNSLYTALPSGDEILVISDHAPVAPLPRNGVRWEALGTPKTNFAITAARAVRKSLSEVALFFEVRRFGEGDNEITLTLKDIGETKLTFDNDGRAFYAQTISADRASYRVEIPADALTADNFVEMPLPHYPRLAVALEFENQELEALVRRALTATDFVADYTSSELADIVLNDEIFAHAKANLPFFHSPDFPIFIHELLLKADPSPPEPLPKLLDPTESDLTRLATVSLGAPAAIDPTTERTACIAWIPATLAVFALLWHFYLIRRRSTLFIIALVLLSLARPVLPLKSPRGTLVVMVDRSRSMPENAQVESERILAQLSKQRPADASLAVISFGENAAIEQRPSPSAFEGFIQDIDPDGSNLSAALGQASTLIDSDTPARGLLLSDGLFTSDLPLAPDFSSFPIDVYPLTRTFAHDLFIESIKAPASCVPTEAIQITANVVSPEISTNDYMLVCGKTVLARGRRVFPAGTSTLKFRDRAKEPSLRAYTLIITPNAEDPTKENNTAKFLVRIEGERPLLHLRDGDQPPLSLAELDNYSGVIIENMSAKDFSPDTLRNLATYVTELGHALALTGGESSFGPGGWHKTPIEDILPVSLELRQEHRKYAIALAIVMDRSGSMNALASGSGRTKMDMADLGAAGAIDMLGATDEVAVLAVDSQPHIILELQSADAAKSKRGKVLSIQSKGGGIFVEEGLLAAFRQIEKAKSPIRHVILFADAADAEEPGDYQNYLRQARAAGVTVSVIALGRESDSDAELLKDIARLGGGECWFEANAEEIPRLFLQDTFLAAKTAMCTNTTGVKATANLSTLTDRIDTKKLPPIGGYNLTYLRSEGNAALVTADEEAAPLLSYRYVGLGRTLAFTGAIAGPYSGPFMDLDAGREVYAAIERWTRGEAQREVSGFTFEEALVPGGLKITATADEDNPLSLASNADLILSSLRTTLPMRREDAETFSAVLPLKGEEIAFPVVRLRQGKPIILPPSMLIHPAEYRRPSDPCEGKGKLTRIAQSTRGQILAAPETAWDNLPLSIRRLPLAPALYLLAVLGFLTLIFWRRVGRRGEKVKGEKVKGKRVKGERVKGEMAKGEVNSTMSALAKVKHNGKHWTQVPAS